MAATDAPNSRDVNLLTFYAFTQIPEEHGATPVSVLLNALQ